MRADIKVSDMGSIVIKANKVMVRSYKMDRGSLDQINLNIHPGDKSIQVKISDVTVLKNHIGKKKVKGPGLFVKMLGDCYLLSTPEYTYFNKASGSSMQRTL